MRRQGLWLVVVLASVAMAAWWLSVPRADLTRPLEVRSGRDSACGIYWDGRRLVGVGDAVSRIERVMGKPTSIWHHDSGGDEWRYPLPAGLACIAVEPQILNNWFDHTFTTQYATQFDLRPVQGSGESLSIREFRPGGPTRPDPFLPALAQSGLLGEAKNGRVQWVAGAWLEVSGNPVLQADSPRAEVVAVLGPPERETGDRLAYDRFGLQVVLRHAPVAANLYVLGTGAKFPVR